MSYRSEEDWIAVYQRKQALWLYGRNRHAILRSKLHSDGFFNSRPIIDDEPLLREVASDLLDKLVEQDLDIKLVDRVIGPATGATKLAEFVSDEIGRRRGWPCAWASPKKADDGAGMVFDDPTRVPLTGEVTLLVEDIFTTGGSVRKVVDAVIQAQGPSHHILPFVGMIVNRSGRDQYIDGDAVVALAALVKCQFATWEAGECPLCIIGSEAVENPKDNWEKLTEVHVN